LNIYVSFAFFKLISTQRGRLNIFLYIAQGYLFLSPLPFFTVRSVYKRVSPDQPVVRGGYLMFAEKRTNKATAAAEETSYGEGPSRHHPFRRGSTVSASR